MDTLQFHRYDPFDNLHTFITEYHNDPFWPREKKKIPLKANREFVPMRQCFSRPGNQGVVRSCLAVEKQPWLVLPQQSSLLAQCAKHTIQDLVDQIVWPYGKNSLKTMSFTSKNVINLTLTFDFFSLRLWWRQRLQLIWRLISGSHSKINVSLVVMNLQSKSGCLLKASRFCSYLSSHRAPF